MLITERLLKSDSGFPCCAFIGLSVVYSTKKKREVTVGTKGGGRICFPMISKVSRQTYAGVHDEPQIVFPATSGPCSLRLCKDTASDTRRAITSDWSIKQCRKTIKGKEQVCG